MNSRSRALACIATTVAVAFVTIAAATPALAQGTIDPSTVGVREMYTQKAIVNVDNSDFPPITHVERPVRSLGDAAGNVYTLSIVNVPRTSGDAASKSYVRKFSPSGALLWERTRTLRTENGSSFSSWGDGSEREVTTPREAVTDLQAAGLVLDGNGELLVVLNTIETESTSNGPRNYFGQALLFVKFTAAGAVKSELFAPNDSGDELEASSSLVALQRLPDDSFVALIRNQNRVFFGADSHEEVAVTRIDNAATSVLYTTVFGGERNPETFQKETSVLPVDIGADAAGNVYVALSQYPQRLGEGYYGYVLRRLNGSGDVVAERRVPGRYNTIDEWNGMVVDAAGNVYIGGSTPFQYDSANREFAFAVAVKISPDLSQQLWRVQAPQRTRFCVGIRLTGAGITLAHSAQEPARNLVSRISTGGDLLWSSDTALQYSDFIVNDAGDVFATGVKSNGAFSYAKMARNGDLQFVRELGLNYDHIIYIYTSHSGMWFTPDGLPTATARYRSGEDRFLTTLELGNPANVNAVAATKLQNISTRLRVETGENVLIGGFIITGDQPKKVIVRGIGPSLAAAGISGVLQNPTLSLDNGAITNDDWRSHQEAAINETGIPPGDEREAAIVATLQPGPHTAILAGKRDANGQETTGVGLVEVYELDGGAPVQLANISTRGRVQTGENVMIGGFIVDGQKTARVLLRALGPSLPVQEILFNPTLELVDANGASLKNDNWGEAANAAEVASILPPEYQSEAALLVTLGPGAYTAIVRDKDNIPGVGLIEAYNLR